MSYLAYFFVGALLCNCIPHLASGLRGEPFPTPFAKPRGIGMSSPIVNFYWGLANGVAGLYLLHRHVTPSMADGSVLTILVGFAVMGSYLSIHFGKVRQSSVAEES